MFPRTSEVHMVISRDTQTRIVYDELHWFYNNCTISYNDSEDTIKLRFRTRKLIDKFVNSKFDPDTIETVVAEFQELKDAFYKLAGLNEWVD